VSPPCSCRCDGYLEIHGRVMRFATKRRALVTRKRCCKSTESTMSKVSGHHTNSHESRPDLRLMPLLLWPRWQGLTLRYCCQVLCLPDRIFASIIHRNGAASAVSVRAGMHVKQKDIRALVQIAASVIVRIARLEVLHDTTSLSRAPV
jgi:hypothetical protein